MARSLSALLSDHDVTVVATGKAAIELFDAGETYDIIYTDMLMREVTGMDVYEHAQRLWPKEASRLVFMTGGAFTARARAFLASATNPCLEKPFDERAVRTVMKSVLAPR